MVEKSNGKHQNILAEYVKIYEAPSRNNKRKTPDIYQFSNYSDPPLHQIHLKINYLKVFPNVIGKWENASKLHRSTEIKTNLYYFRTILKARFFHRKFRNIEKRRCLIQQRNLIETLQLNSIGQFLTHTLKINGKNYRLAEYGKRLSIMCYATIVYCPKQPQNT